MGPDHLLGRKPNYFRNFFFLPAVPARDGTKSHIFSQISIFVRYFFNNFSHSDIFCYCYLFTKIEVYVVENLKFMNCALCNKILSISVSCEFHNRIEILQKFF